jgi:quercetin dioxygenase-like cupin family protein
MNFTLLTKKEIMKAVFIILLLTSVTIQIVAQNESIFPKGEISKADNHTGTVWLKELNHPDSIFNISLAHATFAPGAKLDWHVHPAGQYLLITEGPGYYQEKGKPIQIVQKGDVIQCLPGVEHWHGAAPENIFSYVGVTPTQKGKTIWGKRVTSDEYNSLKVPTTNNVKADREIMDLSKLKWKWMADKNIDSLDVLFHEKSVFVHMGGSWGKTQEINIIKGGGIHYKKADIHSVSVNIIDNTAILLNNITLLAVVGGNEVTNPFTVTEVYIKEDGKWKLGSLSFTKLVGPNDR